MVLGLGHMQSYIVNYEMDKVCDLEVHVAIVTYGQIFLLWIWNDFIRVPLLCNTNVVRHSTWPHFPFYFVSSR